MLSRFFVVLALHGDDRRADAFARGSLGHILAADIELVRGSEIVELRDSIPGVDRAGA